MYATTTDRAGPALPEWFLYPATILFAVLAFYTIIRTRGTAARFLIFVLWLRYTLSSLHEFTYTEAFPGVRWVAVGSLFSIVLGLVVLDKRRFISPPLIPVSLICAIMLISGIVNQLFALALEPFLRFVFFLVCAVATWEALETVGAKIFRRLLVVFAQPITYQLASIALSVVKSGELDGSVSYIGGFYHEELFSLILATTFLVAVLASKVGRLTRLLLCIAAFVGIYLANYRTTMLAIAPLGLAALLLLAPQAFRETQRTLVRRVIAVAAAALFVVGFATAEERFSDLGALAEGPSLIKPPATFTFEEQRVLSSRPYIWSMYLHAYSDATPTQKLIGFGPDSWEGKFPHYAHNTLISSLYEIGIAGSLAILLLWAVMLRLALRAQPPDRGVLIAAHASFFILNMGTMPHWQVEGNIFYGLLCGYTIAKARVGQVAAQHAFSPAVGPRPLPGSVPALVWPRHPR